MQGLGGPRSPLFRKLFIAHVAVLAVTALSIGGLSHRRVERGLVAALEKDLVDTTALMVPFAERAFSGELEDVDIQSRLRGVELETGTRLTLIRADGTVVGDSEGQPGRMENHGNRPEVVEAMETGRGVSRRRSRAVDRELVYLARRVGTAGGARGVVRAAVPLEHADRFLGLTRFPVLLGAGVGVMFALVASYVVASRITAALQRVGQAVERIRDGDYDTRPVRVPDDEVGDLAGQVSELGQELGGRIERLSQGDARLRAMLAGMVEGIVAVDAEDRVLFCNSASRRQLAMGNAPVEGERLWEVARAAGLEALLEGARSQGSTQQGELVVGTAAREQVLEAHASPYEGGLGRELVIVLHDITELRRLERVRRDFVANVSHELKTPLTSIKGFVETLLDGALYDERHNRRFLERVADNVDRLSHLVTDLLSLARIESQAEIERVPVDWQRILRDVARRHQPDIERKGLRFEADEQSLYVLGDAEALTQVLENLLENAIRYTPDGGAVEVRLRQEPGRGVLEVSDTGIGIPREEQDRVFERFYRVDKARSRALGGTGLGLSIVKNLVLALGGEVSVESEVDRGSRFRVALPSGEE